MTDTAEVIERTLVAPIHSAVILSASHIGHTVAIHMDVSSHAGIDFTHYLIEHCYFVIVMSTVITVSYIEGTYDLYTHVHSIRSHSKRRQFISQITQRTALISKSTLFTVGNVAPILGSHACVSRRYIAFSTSHAGSAIRTHLASGDITGKGFTDIAGTDLVSTITHGAGIIGILAVGTVVS